MLKVKRLDREGLTSYKQTRNFRSLLQRFSSAISDYMTSPSQQPNICNKPSPEIENTRVHGLTF
jgi:hypothetical protein